MSKTLVACFSASGITAVVAKKLAAAIDGDFFEIKPTEPYSAADLDWTNQQSRSSVEMNDRNSRPPMKEKIEAEKWSGYTTVFVGFPIWWYREPSIIDSFLDGYDFTGKTIVPFATSGSSDIGDTSKNMHTIVQNGRVAAGKRFSSNVSERELAAWAKAFV